MNRQMQAEEDFFVAVERWNKQHILTHKDQEVVSDNNPETPVISHGPSLSEIRRYEFRPLIRPVVELVV